MGANTLSTAEIWQKRGVRFRDALLTRDPGSTHSRECLGPLTDATRYHA